MWLEKQDLISLMEEWWNQLLASGKRGFVLRKKLRYLK
ncbi:hypothetical protein IFM89_038236 [Coptis chinensis]|uniref:Uncharacterized protein n=1 Tax=Coptis chinensis TaxID=261450 RepID=A0A835HXU9_9MAGN|nr:hypothetical protein IFM89_038236 [Coptis chinensis]